MSNPFPIHIQHLDSDPKLEVIANELLDLGIDQDSILVSPMGEFFRGFRRDISDLKVLEDSLGNPLFYQIKTSRDGIYDGLPENLFHDNIDEILSGKEGDPIENIKKNRQEEEAARKFFQIVEKEFFRLRILFEQEERKTIIGTAQFNQHEIFLHLWQELGNLESRYIIPLMQILPLVTKYQMKTKEVEHFLFFLLRNQVEIEITSEPTVYQPSYGFSTLGKNFLGVDLILGNTFYDFDPVYKLKIGPLSLEELENYMPGMPAAEALDVFIQYYFPLQSIVSKEFILAEQSGTIFLKPENSPNEFQKHESRLGLSSFI